MRKNDNPKVSILVPIYGTELYIEKCARTLFEQTYDNIEFIFVNDYTRDNSVNVLKRVLEEYPLRKSQTRIIEHKENKGLAGSRLTGLQNATGEYVWCVDSDDYVEKNAVEVLLPYMLDDYDFISFNYILNDGKTFKEFKSKKLSVENLLINRIPPSIWKCVVKRKLFKDNNIWPVVGINFSEDYLLTARLILVAEKKILLKEEHLYYYNVSNLNSYMNNMNVSSYENSADAAMIVYDFYLKHGGIARYRNQLAGILSMCYVHLKKVDSKNVRCASLENIIGGLNQLFLVVVHSCLKYSHKESFIRLLAYL